MRKHSIFIVWNTFFSRTRKYQCFDKFSLVNTYQKAEKIFSAVNANFRLGKSTAPEGRNQHT